MSKLKELFESLSQKTVKSSEFNKSLVSIGSKPTVEKRNKVHIFHHFDADGFAAAAVIIKYTLGLHVDREDIICYVCEHSSKMDLSNIKKDEYVFILDYSFPDCDKEDLKQLYNTVTKNIIWIDHHSTSDRIINMYSDSNNIIGKYPEFAAMANKGLVETSNKYAGCMLAYFWGVLNSCEMVNGKLCIKSVGVHTMDTSGELVFKRSFDPDDDAFTKIYDEAPTWIKLVSDHDTFRHEIDRSIDFNNGLTYEGLYRIFIDPDNENSFSNMLDSNEMNNLINNIINEGHIIGENDARKNKKLVDKNGFIATFKFHDTTDPDSGFTRLDCYDKTEEFKVACFNGYGNSLVFGDLYDQYDAVCIFSYAGENYKYSMYAKKDSDIDCSIAGLYYNGKYKLNGGGHKHAAGWSAPLNIFENSKSIDIYKVN